MVDGCLKVCSGEATTCTVGQLLLLDLKEEIFSTC